MSQQQMPSALRNCKAAVLAASVVVVCASAALTLMSVHREDRGGLCPIVPCAMDPPPETWSWLKSTKVLSFAMSSPGPMGPSHSSSVPPPKTTRHGVPSPQAQPCPPSPAGLPLDGG